MEVWPSIGIARRARRMRTDERTAMQSASSLRYAPVEVKDRLPLREAVLLLFYHLRLLNWWLFALVGLSFLGFGGLVWMQLQIGGSQGLSNAMGLSRFVLEPGAGLFAGMFASSLIVSD